MKDRFETWLKDQQNLDVFEPEEGHFERFRSRLKTRKKPLIYRIDWRWMSVAAAVILMFGLWFGNSTARKEGLDLADVSPKMEETQQFFVQTIRMEVKKIEKFKNPDNEKIINDGLKQLEKLEKDYNKLKLELKESDENQMVIYAMITNFQKRIEILQQLMNTLQETDKIKQQKQIS